MLFHDGVPGFDCARVCWIALLVCFHLLWALCCKRMPWVCVDGIDWTRICQSMFFCESIVIWLCLGLNIRAFLFSFWRECWFARECLECVCVCVCVCVFVVLGESAFASPGILLNHLPFDCASVCSFALFHVLLLLRWVLNCRRLPWVCEGALIESAFATPRFWSVFCLQRVLIGLFFMV